MKLKEIEGKVRKEFALDKFKNLCEAIMQNELAIKFLETKEGMDTIGSENAKNEILKLQNANSIRQSEKSFLEKLLLKE